MRFERVVVERGACTQVLDLHPRLTVLAGLGAEERRELVGEIIGALGPSRSGVHVELVDRNGRHLAVFRPHGGDHRAIEVDRAIDVSGELGDGNGAIDLLNAAGIGADTAAQALRCAAGDLVARSEGDEVVRRLAALDQDELWTAAERLRSAREALRLECEAAGAEPDDAAAAERVANARAGAQRLDDRAHRLKWQTPVVPVVALGAGTLLTGSSTTVALVVLGIGLLTSVVGLAAQAWNRRKLGVAQDVAAEYYRTQIGRSRSRKALVDDGPGRASLFSAAAAHRSANDAWVQVAGAVDVDRALRHADDVADAARVHTDVATLVAVSPAAGDPDERRAAELAQVLVARLARVRHLGGEGFPLLLDEPFEGLSTEVKPALLELLVRTTAGSQVIVFTSDDDVTDWARLEVLSSDLAVIEGVPVVAPVRGAIAAAPSA